MDTYGHKVEKEPASIKGGQEKVLIKVYYVHTDRITPKPITLLDCFLRRLTSVGEGTVCTDVPIITLGHVATSVLLLPLYGGF